MLRSGLVRLDVLYKVLREGITDTVAFEQNQQKVREVRDRFFPGEFQVSGSSPETLGPVYLSGSEKGGK